MADTSTPPIRPSIARMVKTTPIQLDPDEESAILAALPGTRRTPLSEAQCKALLQAGCKAIALYRAQVPELNPKWSTLDELRPVRDYLSALRDEAQACRIVNHAGTIFANPMDLGSVQSQASLRQVAFEHDRPRK